MTPTPELTLPERAACLSLLLQETERPTTVLRRECELLVCLGLAEYQPERWLSTGRCWSRVQLERFELTAEGERRARRIYDSQTHSLGHFYG